jgi:DNA repair exonuclease SbcCD ATPase subunit
MGDEGKCNEHTGICVSISEIRTELKAYKESVEKTFESIQEEIDKLRIKSGEHYGATQKLEVAITEINTTLRQYKETMDRLDNTLKEQNKDNKNISTKTTQIYDLLQQASDNKCNTDKVTVKFIDVIKDSFTTWRVVIVLLIALVAGILGLKWDDMIKVVLGG